MMFRLWTLNCQLKVYYSIYNKRCRIPRWEGCLSLRERGFRSSRGANEKRLGLAGLELAQESIEIPFVQLVHQGDLPSPALILAVCQDKL